MNENGLYKSFKKYTYLHMYVHAVNHSAKATNTIIFPGVHKVHKSMSFEWNL